MVLCVLFGFLSERPILFRSSPPNMLPYFNFSNSFSVRIVPYSPPCCRASKCRAIVEVLIRIKMWSVGIDLFAKSLEDIGAGVLGHDTTQVDVAGYV